MFDGIAKGEQHMVDYGTIFVNLVEDWLPKIPDELKAQPEFSALNELGVIFTTWRGEVTKAAKDLETFVVKRDWVGLPQVDAPKSRELLRQFQARHPELLKGVRLK